LIIRWWFVGGICPHWPALAGDDRPGSDLTGIPRWRLAAVEADQMGGTNSQPWALGGQDGSPPCTTPSAARVVRWRARASAPTTGGDKDVGRGKLISLAATRIVPHPDEDPRPWLGDVASGNRQLLTFIHEATRNWCFTSAVVPTITFAGTEYRAGRSWARTCLDVNIVAGPVQLSKDAKVIRVHPIRHDHSRELGAVASPEAAPVARTPPSAMSGGYRNSFCRPGTGT
jgi:hypothetical protein